MKKESNLYTIKKIDDKTNLFLKNSVLKDVVLCALNQVSNENLYTPNSFDFFPNDLNIEKIGEKKYRVDISINIWKKVNEELIFNQIKEEINSAISQEFSNYQLELNMKCIGNLDL